MNRPGIKELFVLLLASTMAGLAQNDATETERGRDLRKLTANKVYRDRIRPHWQAGNGQFWYEVKTGAETHEFILVDAEKGTRQPAFDHARLAAALSVADSFTPDQLPIDNLEFSGNTLTFTAKDKRWACDLNAYTLAERPASPAEPLQPLALDSAPRASTRTGEETALTFVNRTDGEIELFWLDTEGERRSYGKLRPGDRHSQHTFAGHVWVAIDNSKKTLLVYEAEAGSDTVDITSTPSGRFHARPHRRSHAPSDTPSGQSPDGHWRAFIRDHNLWISATNGSEKALGTNATDDDAYSEPIHWSPDSKRIALFRIQKGDEHKVYLIESSPKDQVQPKLQSYDYLKPGDRVPIAKPHLFDISTAREIPVGDELFPNPWSADDLRWSPDSSRFTFVYNQRGHQVLRIIGVNASTGGADTVIDEHSGTFIDYSGKYFAEYLDDTCEIIWMSERDGWNHLYLYDAKTGQVKNQITKGEWVVRGVERMDREKRQVWFRASGIRAGQDPYYIHFARVNFDGTGLVVLTQGEGTHSIAYSPDNRFFIDTYSRVDLPPVNELRRSEDGALVCALERGDWSALLAAGWRAPERFSAKARDGQTDIYGIINTPTNFDPKKRYPVIENIYAGPQDSFVPKGFSSLNSMQELAEQGFVVVQIDGMGTSNRSKKFHDVCWKNLVDAGLPDRILWMKAAAATRPWMDLERVGIYGTSAGGQNALGALLTHPEFYKAGVADCGCHDNRMDKIWWNEQWMGWPIGPHYEEQSNVTLAHNLKGKLFLMVGEMDRNVDPASTMQVVNALIKADKDFDLLVMPGAGHGIAGSPYARRRLEQFFVKNLIGP